MRIIPAIDIIEGQCVRLSKGDYDTKKVYNENPLEVAKKFEAHGIKHLHLVDLDGAKSKHIVNHKVLEQIAIKTSLKIDFGGGLKTDDDLRIAFESGAGQITGGSIAVKDSETFIGWIQKYGADKIILGADAMDEKVDAKQIDGEWIVHLVGGKVPTERKLFEWAKEVEERGAGEILFTSMDHDGTKNGFANIALSRLSEELNIPIIASGGAGNIQHFADTFINGKADAALAASVFHFKEIKIKTLKTNLQGSGIPVRV
ncbi:UNVERIFIED_CONTAM: hypothetical protein GTU68_001376 [Idotea baltica]|nr:hypothetical protein [Idotea baltica]